MTNRKRTQRFFDNLDPNNLSRQSRINRTSYEEIMRKGRAGNAINKGIPVTPTPSISQTPSITPSITPTASITPSVATSPTMTPTMTLTPNLSVDNTFTYTESPEYNQVISIINNSNNEVIS